MYTNAFVLLAFTIQCTVTFEWVKNEYPKSFPLSCDNFNHHQSYDVKSDSNNEIPAYHVSLIEAADENTGIGAKCLDGSPAAYYYRPTPGINTTNESLLAPTKYFIYLAGGAWCSPFDGHHIACGWDDCYSRSLGSAGSTLNDSLHFMLPSDTRPYFSTDKSINPLMYNWNVAYTRYCDGGSYANNLDKAVNVTTTNGNVSLYFRGHRNLMAILDDLLLNKGMMNATDIVIGGCSSGGLAVFLNLDFISEYVVNKTKNSNIRIMGMADSGFFYNYQSAANFSNAMKYLYTSQNLSVNKHCIAAYGEKEDEYFNCVYAQNVAPYIKTRMFSSQSQYDDWQIYCDLNDGNVTLVNEYGANVTKAYKMNFTDTGISDNSHCGYLSSCRYHCGWHNVYNVTVGKAMFDFYYGNNTKNLYADDETYPCSNNCCNIQH